MKMQFFPTDGRAATMIKSFRWKPAVILSNSVNPVGIPVTSPFDYAKVRFYRKHPQERL